MFLFSCAYAYAYVAYVMLIAQVGTRLKQSTDLRVTRGPWICSVRMNNLEGQKAR